MKKLIFLITLSIIITYSFVTRASAATRHVTLNAEIKLNNQTQIISAVGTLPNPCTKNVQPSIKAINSNTLQIDFIAEFKGPYCIMVVGDDYVVNVAPTTIQNELLNLGLNTKTDYEIVLSNGTSLGHLKLSTLGAFEFVNVESFHSDVFPGLKNDNRTSTIELNKATD
jgi:hypothetical protein